MTLWAVGNNQRFLFFNGITESDFMFMKINGTMTKFIRTASQGKDFYGQKTFQNFKSNDGKILVQVAVIQGNRGEIESVAINSGVMLIMTENTILEIAVEGVAGC